MRAALGKILASPGEGEKEPTPSGWRRRLGAEAPLLLLALAMAVVLLLNIDREHYYALIDWETAKNLALAENLSPERNFRLLARLEHPYNSFPIGGPALIKLVILPFGDNLAAKIFAGRMLMLAFLSAAAFLAYHSILRISSNRWIALTAVMIAFSSYYIFFYHNYVTNEFMMELFGIMLIFHAMIIFRQEGRYWQLVVKTCIALLLGWRAYSILAPFIILGLAEDAVAAIKARRGSLGAVLAPLQALARSRYLMLGIVAVMFGAALLFFNLMQEYNALGGQTPTLWSARENLSWTHVRGFDGEVYLRRQFYRVAGSAFPQALANWPGNLMESLPDGPPLRYVFAGVGLTAASMAGLLFTRRRMPLFALTSSGFIWALTAPNHVYTWLHQHIAIFYIGVPLTLTALLLLAARRLGAGRILGGAGLAACALFTLSAFQTISPSPEAARSADVQQTIISDMTQVRQRLNGEKSVFVAEEYLARERFYGTPYAHNYYLSGSRIYYQEESPIQNSKYDFVLIPHLDESAPLLTPDNQLVFLYGGADPRSLIRSRIDAIAASASPNLSVRAVFNVSVADGAVIYSKEPCVSADVQPKFFLHVFPENEEDLPERRRGSGYDNLDFVYSLWGVAADGACAARVPLPDYPAAFIRTGQWARMGQSAGRELWDAALPINSDPFRAIRQSVADKEPDARSVFDLHLDQEERALIYVKDPCEASETRHPFFLHVVPARADDLPENRREFGFDNLDFDFGLHGAALDGNCVARVALPGYEAASITTGQWERGRGEIWSATIPLGEEASSP